MPMTLTEIQDTMSNCYHDAVISEDMDVIVGIITYHTALAVAEAMMMDSIDSIPVM